MFSRSKSPPPTSERIRRSSRPLTSELTARWRLWTLYLEAKCAEIEERLTLEPPSTPGDPEGGSYVHDATPTLDPDAALDAAAPDGRRRDRRPPGDPDPLSRLDDPQPAP